MKILCVIPSRLNSSRLPQKALTLIQGKPMVQWVYERAKQCDVFTKVLVATDSPLIAACIENVGGQVEMTDEAIQTGSDRAAVVAARYPDMEIIVNLQGDQPFIRPDMLTTLVSPYLHGETPDMTTLACPLEMEHEYIDPSVVKVITDQQDHAIYFSRAPIPYRRDPTVACAVRHHLGVYAYRRAFLTLYNTLSQTPLEKAELLEQLRVLENGYRIRVCHTPHRILEINTPDELARAQTTEF